MQSTHQTPVFLSPRERNTTGLKIRVTRIRMKTRLLARATQAKSTRGTCSKGSSKKWTIRGMNKAAFLKRAATQTSSKSSSDSSASARSAAKSLTRALSTTRRSPPWISISQETTWTSRSQSRSATVSQSEVLTMYTRWPMPSRFTVTL